MFQVLLPLAKPLKDAAPVPRLMKRPDSLQKKLDMFVSMDPLALKNSTDSFLLPMVLPTKDSLARNNKLVFSTTKIML